MQEDPLGRGRIQEDEIPETQDTEITIEGEEVQYEFPYSELVPTKKTFFNNRPYPTEPVNQKIIKGKVKELVQPKQFKIPEPIRAMVGKEQLITQCLLNMVVIPDLGIIMGMILNESLALVKGMAYSLQSLTPRYWVK